MQMSMTKLRTTRVTNKMSDDGDDDDDDDEDDDDDMDDANGNDDGDDVKKQNERQHLADKKKEHIGHPKRQSIQIINSINTQPEHSDRGG